MLSTGEAVKTIAESNSGSTFATENDLVLPDLRDHAVLPLLLSIVPEIEELDAHSKLAESTRNAWIVQRILHLMSMRKAGFAHVVPGRDCFPAGSGGPVGHPGPRPAHVEATTPTDPPVQKVGCLRAHSGLLLHFAGALLPSFLPPRERRTPAQSPAFRDDGKPFRGKVWDDCCCATR